LKGSFARKKLESDALPASHGDQMFFCEKVAQKAAQKMALKMSPKKCRPKCNT
jgi:hypothetical protein